MHSYGAKNYSHLIIWPKLTDTLVYGLLVKSVQSYLHLPYRVLILLQKPSFQMVSNGQPSMLNLPILYFHDKGNLATPLQLLNGI